MSPLDFGAKLAEYHKQVWDAAADENNSHAYDLVGVEIAEELVSAFESLHGDSDWIMVESEHPPEGVNVLVYLPSEDYLVANHKNGDWADSLLFDAIDKPLMWQLIKPIPDRDLNLPA